MIKRLGKSKKNKKGAILVIVVLILALAMIFIASAMMLTQATRRRLYSNAMQSQARLTVTAASEAFLEALNMQEITDTALEALIDKTHASTDKKVKMVVEGVPGMSSDEDNCTYVDIWKEPTDSTIVYCDFTTIIGDETENVQVVLKAEDSEPASTTSFKNQIEVCGDVDVAELKFTSGVGMWNKTEISTPSDNCVVMRDGYYGRTGDSLIFSDVVFGGSADIYFGGGDIFYGNNMVFLQGAQMAGRSSNTIKSPNIYFIGKSGNQPGMTLKSEGGSVNIDLWGNGIESTNFIFCGRTVEDDSWTTEEKGNKIGGVVKKSGANCYFVDSTGNCLKSGGVYVEEQNAQYKQGNDGKYTVDNAAYGTDSNGNAVSVTPSNIKTNVARFYKWDYSKNSTSNPFPTASKVFKEMAPSGYKTSNGSDKYSYVTYGPKDETTGVVPEYPADTVIPNGKKYNPYPVTAEYPAYKMVNGQPEKTLNLDTVTSSKYLEPGFYYVTGTEYKNPYDPNDNPAVRGGAESYRGDPIVIAIDGDKGGEYRFYFEGGKNFLLRNFIFAIYNADSDKPVLFILEDGANVQFSHNNDKVSQLCSSGILSMPNRPNCTDKDTYVKYIKDHTWASESKVWDNSYVDKSGTKIKYSEYYDSVHKPAAFLFGANDNIVTMGPNVTFECYIGLYGDNGGFGPITGSGGGGGANKDERQNIYGRVECSRFCTWDNNVGFTYLTDESSGDFCMPYCPQPGATDTKPKKRIAKSKYSVVDIIYYYGSHTEEETGS
ncbi:hypothetical protein B0O40_2067 [Ruminococcaceae bacterium R-25]|nr:hypothetical protein B0O40_2067 [Ruminococcaceae bacterium R-25]SUQ21927.1 hypothetical protein SAMN06297423_2067 [Oscillospiraceae bacterium]